MWSSFLLCLGMGTVLSYTGSRRSELSEGVLRVWEGRKRHERVAWVTAHPHRCFLWKECINVHSSSTHNNLELETTGMLAYVWMNGILCTNENESSTDYATAWVNPANAMESKRRQTQKTTYCMILFVWNVKNRQIYGDRKYVSGTLGFWGENGGFN